MDGGRWRLFLKNILNFLYIYNFKSPPFLQLSPMFNSCKILGIRVCVCMNTHTQCVCVGVGVCVCVCVYLLSVYLYI
jgi:hypothetical protein